MIMTHQASLLLVGNNLLTCGEAETFDAAAALCRNNFSSAVEVAKVDDVVLWHRGVDLTSIQPGFYAFAGKRYHVAIGKGKWDGYRFLTTGSAYHDPMTLATVSPYGELSSRTEDRSHGKMILTAIAADPVARSCEYGKITGTCGKCGRKLENPVSRERGIGPVCAKRLGVN